jgi:TolB protein
MDHWADRSFAQVRRFTLVAAIASLAACGATAPTPGPATITTAAPIPSGAAATPFAAAPSPSAAASLLPSSGPATTTAPIGGPIGATGSVVVLGNDGSLTLVDAAGVSTVLASAADGAFAFPAWSPDGSHIAAARNDGQTATILVFDAAAAAAGDPEPPVVVLQSSTIGPFYLSWRPDGKAVSYLATDPDGLALRVAPADGSGALDGSDPASIIQRGNPFYYDWTGSDGLLAHVGTGTGAFLGELGLDGAPSETLGQPGDFRSAVVSADGSAIGFAQVDDKGGAHVVLADRDGTTRRSVPVFGSAAMTFDPTGDRLAAIGATEAGQATLDVPIGPLRVLERENDRILLDGSVVGFWWSPDGETIAALRLQPADVEASTGGSEPHLLFVDARTGDVSSQTAVVPGRLFITQLLTYFDQYALSHRLWSPDSATFLMPLMTSDGATRVAVLPRDGGDPVLIDGQAGFWSPPTD